MAVAREPALVGGLGGLSFRVRLPEFALTQIGWQDLVTGVMVLVVSWVSALAGMSDPP